MVRTVPFIDSHTGGEPTRLVLDHGLDLGTGPLAERSDLFRARHDRFRAAVVREPRASDVFVGALLCPPSEARHTAAVIFFNNVGTLGMCGHGTIGVIASLAYLGRIQPGRHVLESPVGTVSTELFDDGRVAVDNVPSYRHRHDVEVPVEGLGTVVGEIAWGGNWFFLTPAPASVPLERGRVDELLELTTRIRRGLVATGVTGRDGAEIDHVELYGPSAGDADARTFVLCPGGAWDRSPCGTGTSAKIACLAAAGELSPGEPWSQESVLGSVFEGRFEVGDGDTVLPTITGTAHVMAEGSLVFDSSDPFQWGLPE